MTTATYTNIQNSLEARLFALEILRNVFIEEPKKEFLALMQKEDFLGHFPFNDCNDLISEGIELINSYMNTTDVANNEAEFNKLHWDFTKLFVGPFELPAPPWESMYVKHDQMLFQQTTKDVENFYKRFQIGVGENNNEASDHIGLQLDFIYHLTRWTYEVLTTKNEVNRYLLSEQLRFYKLHLNKFYKQFTNNVIAHAQTDYYRGFGKVLQGYLTLDYLLIEELLILSEGK